MTYQFISDPGHGWLQITINDLVEALKAGQGFSSFSYANPKTGMVYLEEDLDASTYLSWKHPNKDYELEERTIDGDCFVRRLPSLLDTRKES